MDTPEVTHWERVHSLGTRPGAAPDAVTLDAWRRELWLLLARRARDLHREVLCGRLGLRDAAGQLEQRGYTTEAPEPF